MSPQDAITNTTEHQAWHNQDRHDQKHQHVVSAGPTGGTRGGTPGLGGPTAGVGGPTPSATSASASASNSATSSPFPSPAPSRKSVHLGQSPSKSNHNGSNAPSFMSRHSLNSTSSLSDAGMSLGANSSHHHQHFQHNSHHQQSYHQPAHQYHSSGNGNANGSGSSSKSRPGSSSSLTPQQSTQKRFPAGENEHPEIYLASDGRLRQSSPATSNHSNINDHSIKSNGSTDHRQVYGHGHSLSHSGVGGEESPLARSSTVPVPPSKNRISSPATTTTSSSSTVSPGQIRTSRTTSMISNSSGRSSSGLSIFKLSKPTLASFMPFYHSSNDSKTKLERTSSIGSNSSSRTTGGMIEKARNSLSSSISGHHNLERPRSLPGNHSPHGISPFPISLLSIDLPQTLLSKYRLDLEGFHHGKGIWAIGLYSQTVTVVGRSNGKKYVIKQVSKSKLPPSAYYQYPRTARRLCTCPACKSSRDQMVLTIDDHPVLANQPLASPAAATAVLVVGRRRGTSTSNMIPGSPPKAPVQFSPAPSTVNNVVAHGHGNGSSRRMPFFRSPTDTTPANSRPPTPIPVIRPTSPPLPALPPTSSSSSATAGQEQLSTLTTTNEGAHLTSLNTRDVQQHQGQSSTSPLSPRQRQLLYSPKLNWTDCNVDQPLPQLPLTTSLTTPPSTSSPKQSYQHHQHKNSITSNYVGTSSSKLHRPTLQRFSSTPILSTTLTGLDVLEDDPSRVEMLKTMSRHTPAPTAASLMMKSTVVSGIDAMERWDLRVQDLIASAAAFSASDSKQKQALRHPVYGHGILNNDQEGNEEEEEEDDDEDDDDDDEFRVEASEEYKQRILDRLERKERRAQVLQRKKLQEQQVQHLQHIQQQQQAVGMTSAASQSTSRLSPHLPLTTSPVRASTSLGVHRPSSPLATMRSIGYNTGSGREDDGDAEDFDDEQEDDNDGDNDDDHHSNGGVVGNSSGSDIYHQHHHVTPPHSGHLQHLLDSHIGGSSSNNSVNNMHASSDPNMGSATSSSSVIATTSIPAADETSLALTATPQQQTQQFPIPVTYSPPPHALPMELVLLQTHNDSDHLPAHHEWTQDKEHWYYVTKMHGVKRRKLKKVSTWWLDISSNNGSSHSLSHGGSNASNRTAIKEPGPIHHLGFPPRSSSPSPVHHQQSLTAAALGTREGTLPTGSGWNQLNESFSRESSRPTSPSMGVMSQSSLAYGHTNGSGFLFGFGSGMESDNDHVSYFQSRSSQVQAQQQQQQQQEQQSQLHQSNSHHYMHHAGVGGAGGGVMVMTPNQTPQQTLQTQQQFMSPEASSSMSLRRQSSPRSGSSRMGKYYRVDWEEYVSL